MKAHSRLIIPKVIRSLISAILLCSLSEGRAQSQSLCLDGFCIGQRIQDQRFQEVAWIIPKDATNEECAGVGCQPGVAFPGYSEKDRERLAEAVRQRFGRYSLVSKESIEALRQYKYECNPSPSGIVGERRFIGIFRSVPSKYLTIVGLRLIDGDLTIYRLARQYPFHNQGELTFLAKELNAKYGRQVLFYEFLSSNAYTEVIKQHRDGWFARSTMFNLTDLSDNAAELVLIDPRTRALLQPTSMPESGEIALPVRLSPQCNRSIPVQ